ncbi:MAG: hypothetical protein RMJ44_00640 [Cytophagales bacterium]|nr:PorT family protein [Bernardetiaceae bacterium]MDW8209566.1 hypothetical protein [Cytophagales bacterium]
MKYQWLILSIILSTELLAQVDFLPPDTLAVERNARVTMGVCLGWGQSRLYGTDLDQISTDGAVRNVGSWMVGLQAITYTGKYGRLLHEINFWQGGAQIKKQNLENAVFRTHFLQMIPLAPAIEWKKIQLYAAPYVSTLLDSYIGQNNDKDRSIFGDPENNTETEKYSQKFDYGIIAAIGLSWKKMLLSCRYQRGFNSIFDNANVFTFGQTQPVINLYHQGWRLIVGYRF